MPSRPPSPWPLLFLLALSVVINYLDRGNLGVAAPLITAELALSDSQMGVLLSAFFWTYALAQVFSGWLVDRWHVALVYGLGFLVWSAATATAGLVHSFSLLVLARLVLGAGESVAFPAYSKILASAFPEHERGLANSILDACSKFGPALGVWLGAWLMGVWGWRVFFLCTGAGALLWLVPWFSYAPGRILAPQDRPEPAGPTWKQLLQSRTVWATFLGLFCHNYNWYLLLTWLPTFLVRERRFSMSGMGAYNAILLSVTALVTMAAGWYSDRLIARRGAAARRRRSFLIAGLAVTGLAMPFTLAPAPWLCAASLACAFTGIGIYVSNCWAFTQTLAGPAAGRWTGMQNAFANLSGVLAPALTGFLVESTGRFFAAVLASAALLWVGAAVYALLVKLPPAQGRQ